MDDNRTPLKEKRFDDVRLVAHSIGSAFLWLRGVKQICALCVTARQVAQLLN